MKYQGKKTRSVVQEHSREDLEKKLEIIRKRENKKRDHVYVQKKHGRVVLGRRYVHQASTSSLQYASTRLIEGVCAFFRKCVLLCAWVSGVKKMLHDFCYNETLSCDLRFLFLAGCVFICFVLIWLIELSIFESMPLMRDWAVKVITR